LNSMKDETVPSLRIGMVNFINTAPIHEIWKKSSHPAGWRVVEAVPSRLNKMLANGEIDLGFVSSYEYCARPNQYRILSDLSISANGSVGSVFLFSKTAPEKLNGCRLLLTNQSETSVSLLKIILEEFYAIKPDYFIGQVSDDLSEEVDGVLAIGDEALRLVGDVRFRFQIDLGEVWKNHTGLPFVFAICCVRAELCVEEPQLVRDVHHELIRCRHQGQEDLDSICQLVASTVPMSQEDCLAYLGGIEYDLDSEKIKALQAFYKFLIQRGEASKDSLPLKLELFED